MLCVFLCSVSLLFIVARAVETEACLEDDPASFSTEGGGKCGEISLLQLKADLRPALPSGGRNSSAIALASDDLGTDVKDVETGGQGETKADYRSAWREAAGLLSANAATVNPHIRGNITFHSGAAIRGVVAQKEMPNGETLLRVPRRLQMTRESFPDLSFANLDVARECAGFSSDMIALAAAVAVERKKGNASFYHAYLHGLPDMDDYLAFHPRFMSATLQDDFAGLALTRDMAEAQVHDAKVQDCFAKWAEAQEPHLVAGLSSDDFSLALIQVRTRCYGLGASGLVGLVPASDLLNTAPSEKMNTIWDPLSGSSNDVFELTVTSDVRAGDELYDIYCEFCGNDGMMRIWGIYLEDNKNSPADSLHANCTQLRPATEAALDLASGKTADQTAPRCLAETVASPEQGPLRCSLARLSWESCSSVWGTKHASGAPMLVQDGSAMRLSAAEMVKRMDRSVIHGVDPAIVKGGRHP